MNTIKSIVKEKANFLSFEDDLAFEFCEEDFSRVSKDEDFLSISSQ